MNSILNCRIQAKPEILKLIGSSGLPEGVKRYCADMVSGKLCSSLKTALRTNAVAVIGNIDRLLTDGSGILARSKEEILFATGFNKNNVSPERFEAALAEIRAVAFLHAGGFSGLKLIGTGIKRTADIRGVRGGKKYVFEVCCIQTANDLISADYLELKYDKKVRQVNSSRKECGCACGGLIFVMDPSGLSASADAPGYKDLARELYARKNNPPATHICILSGSSGCVFPEW